MASPNPKRTPSAKARRRANPHEGSSLDDFLREEGSYDEAAAVAIKEALAFQLEKAMRAQHLSKSEVARRMGTSRAALDRLLDAGNASVTLATLLRAASALGLELSVRLRRPRR